VHLRLAASCWYQLATEPAAMGTSTSTNGHPGRDRLSRRSTGVVTVLDDIVFCKRPALSQTYRGKPSYSALCFPTPANIVGMISNTRSLHRAAGTGIGDVRLVEKNAAALRHC